MTTALVTTESALDAMQAVMDRALARGIDAAAVARKARRVAPGIGLSESSSTRSY